MIPPQASSRTVKIFKFVLIGDKSRDNNRVLSRLGPGVVEVGWLPLDLFFRWLILVTALGVMVQAETELAMRPRLKASVQMVGLASAHRMPG